jgi:hypothetical protein
MSIATSYLNNSNVLQAVHEERDWLVRVPLDVFWHMLGIVVPELAAGTRAPTVELAVDSDGRCVTITTSDLTNLHPPKGLDQARCGLVWIPILISREIF